MSHSVSILREAKVMSRLELCESANQFIRDVLPEGDFRKVFLKPNWVFHSQNPSFPSEALVTSPAVILAVVRACFNNYSNIERVIVGDVPLQSCDFSLMCKQSGTDQLIALCAKEFGSRVQFLDLRREVFRLANGFLQRDLHVQGDPSGYSEVILDQASQLEEVSHKANRFRVSDYDPEDTTSAHKPGEHRYLICRSILESDLIINLPKMKTHQKTGITGALKNLVGINGSKAYLVHHQVGRPSQGGDEFPEDIPKSILIQVRMREFLQKSSPLLFRMAKWGWEGLKWVRGIKTEATRENMAKGGIYMGSGSWYGNDSIWRMVYDLNLALVFAKSEGGRLAPEPQRQVVSILDGIISGEGNGPLQPLPVRTGVLVASRNPFLVDFAMAKLMGFDWQKIALLANYHRFPNPCFSSFDPLHFFVEMDGALHHKGIDSIPVHKCFLPPPGWNGHIELDRAQTI